MKQLLMLLTKHPLRSREAHEAPASDLVIQSLQLGLQNGTRHSIHLCDPIFHLVQPVPFGERRKEVLWGMKWSRKGKGRRVLRARQRSSYLQWGLRV